MTDYSHKRVRNAFLDYFASRQHTIVPSASLLPAGDPSLLFTNAGMNQFKDLFLGREKRVYTRAASSQKCLRVGGKHNDLDNVGFTPRHHTFFEMLGNFSFGDYFKTEAISHAWELVTEVYGLDPSRIWASVFSEDEESYEIWHNHIKISPDRIIRMGAKDNFWAMGDTGPCGPCSELYFDQGPEIGCKNADCSPACECGRHLEFWNLVFMQYNRDDKGEMTPLPSPSIDTGMGLERMAAILQGKVSNYDTDLFTPLTTRISKLTGHPLEKTGENAPSFRVIADHTRAVAFLISDGVFPSNEGRGYVLRRIIRRSLRFAHRLGWHSPVIPELVDTLVETLGETYTEIAGESTLIKDLALQEETRFEKTLDRGVEVVEETISRYRDAGRIPGEEMFRLYDTHGIPFDFVEEMAREHNVTADIGEFNDHLKLQKERSKKSASFKDDYQGLFERVASEQPPTSFIGFENLETDAKVLAIVRDGAQATEIGPGEEVDLLLDRTVFYAESGGQTGDTGTLQSPEAKAEILATSKPVASHYLHHLRLLEGKLKRGDNVSIRVDSRRRSDITRHHTATHLLHAALRKVLGTSVKQMGSLVNDEKLRFDYSFSRALTRQEILQIEESVNQTILDDVPVNIEILPVEEAKKRGALAFFGDKYGEEVRVVSVPGYSMEFCGGCHVQRTGEIGSVVITSEKAVAAGSRRVEAVAGMASFHLIQQQTSTLEELHQLMPGSESELPDRIRQLQEKSRELGNSVRDLKERVAAGGGAARVTAQLRGTPVLLQAVSDLDTSSLRALADTLKAEAASGIVVIGNSSGEKATILVAVTQDLLPAISASVIAKEIGALMGGSGGGKPHLAQAGGKAPEDMENFLRSIPVKLEEAN